MPTIKTLATGSSGNLYLLESGPHRILIEAGIPFKKLMKALNFNLNVSGCLLTHYHKDHSFSAHDLMKNGIPVFCTKETGEFLKFTDNYLWPVIRAGQQFLVPGANVSVLPFKTNHDTEGSVGFVIRFQSSEDRILFATDTGSIPYKFNKLSHIMIECNFSEEWVTEENAFVMNRTMKTHMSLEKVVKFLKNNDLSRLKEVHLIHLSDKNSHADRFKRTIQGITGCPVYVP